ncbi:hypothetical protein KR52_10870 [Synechococcus sp. KORDI-52]|nr:hypothetical protein KR52_10870 [Synechococcus sp. KORDI-52]
MRVLVQEGPIERSAVRSNHPLLDVGIFDQELCNSAAWNRRRRRLKGW